METPKTQTQEKNICCLKEDQSEFLEELIIEKSDVPVPHAMEKTIEVAKLIPQEQVQNRTVRQIIDDPIPRVMEETLEVETLLADNKLSSKLDGGCAAQAETLLQNKILRVIKKNHVTKCMDMFTEIAKLNDDHKKLVIHENSVDDFEIAKLLRLNTSKSGDEQISLEEYVDHMKEGQNNIHCITGDSFATVSSRSFREHSRKKGHEVLLVADPVDEYAVQQPTEFDGTKPKPTTLDTDTALVRDSICEQLFDEAKTENEGGTRRQS